MKLCRSCNVYYENIDKDQKFCATCGGLLEDVNICPECQTVNPVDASLCCKCGSKLVPESNSIIVYPSINSISSGGNVTIPANNEIPHAESVEPKKKFSISNEQKKLIGGLCAAAIIAGGGYFYFAGPSLHHVESLRQDSNIEGLVEVVNNRAESGMFEGTTESAVKAIIDLSNQTYSDGVKRVGGFLLGEKVNINQKKAIVKAFTDKKMVIPHFYEVYENDNNKEIRPLLQDNGLNVDSDIFKKKLVDTFNSIIESSRSNFSDYVLDVDKAKVWNVNNLAEDGAFDNLLAVTRLFAIQQYVKNGDDNQILKYLEEFQGYAGANIISKNRNYFANITNCIKSKKAAFDELFEARSTYAAFDYDKQYDELDRREKNARSQLNQYDYLAYVPIQFLPGSRLLVQTFNGRAVITNPEMNYRRNTRYEDYVERLNGSYYHNGFYLPTYEVINVDSIISDINNITEDKITLNKKLDSLKANIDTAKAKTESETAKANNLMNAMLLKLNNVKGTDVINFSKDDNIVPIF